MGCPHPDYLLKMLSARQFAEWGAFYAIEPWGFEIADARHGVACSVAANAMGGKATPREFMMGTPPESDEALSGRELAESLKAALGAVAPKP